MASPGVVVRRGKDRNYVTGHSRWTSGSRAGFRGGAWGPGPQASHQLNPALSGSDTAAAR